MPEKYTPLIRIGLWIIGTWLISRGFPPEVAQTIQTDPDFFAAAQLVIGGLSYAVAAGWYWLAKRFGWAT